MTNFEGQNMLLFGARMLSIGKIVRRRSRRICEVSVLPLAFLVMTGLLYQSANNIQPWNLPTKKVLTHIGVERASVRKFDVLLNSYMRAGSSFTGRLLGYREDSFYWYEPLWNFNCVVYYKGREEVCSSDIHRCINVVHSRTNTTKRYHSLSEIQEFLTNLYRCNFTDVSKAVKDGMTDVLSGPIWGPYSECRKHNNSKTTCVKLMETFCKKATHRVTKVLRVSADNLENILLDNTNLKVIQLFRDPRAVVNSRLTTDWYYLKENKSDVEFKAVRANADGLCKRMMYDFGTGLKLKKKFPTRFAFLLYEDIYSDMGGKVSDLFRYLGMNFSTVLNTSDIGHSEHIIPKQSSDFSSWWRKQMSFGAAKAVEESCSDVFSLLPYKKITSEKEMRDMNLSSWKLTTVFETQKLVNY